MDITISQTEAGLDHRNSKQDPWDGVLDRKGNKRFCRFCRHDVRDHNKLAAIVARPGDKRPTMIGLSYLACRQCGADKGTEVAVCYVPPADIRQNAEAVGLLYSGNYTHREG